MALKNYTNISTISINNWLTHSFTHSIHLSIHSPISPSHYRWSYNLPIASCPINYLCQTKASTAKPIFRTLQWIQNIKFKSCFNTDFIEFWVGAIFRQSSAELHKGRVGKTLAKPQKGILALNSSCEQKVNKNRRQPLLQLIINIIYASVNMLYISTEKVQLNIQCNRLIKSLIHHPKAVFQTATFCSGHKSLNILEWLQLISIS